MPAFLHDTPTTERALLALTGRRSRRGVLAGVAAVGLVAAFVFQSMAFTSGTPLAGLVRVAYGAVVFAAMAALGTLLAHALSRDGQEAHPRALWQVLFVGVVVLAVGLGLFYAFAPDGLPDDGQFTFGFGKNGEPRAGHALVLMPLLSVVDFAFATFALFRLRSFVLYKRTRRTLRNWRAMVGAMVLGAVVSEVIGLGAAETSVGRVMSSVVVVMMFVNVWRASWLVFLSLRQKFAALGLTLLLFLLFVYAVAAGSLVSGGYGYVPHFSPGVQGFCAYVFGFGALYCGVSFLYLLFHLPTTTDFERKAGERRAFGTLTDLSGAAFDRARLAEAVAAAQVAGATADRAWLALVDDATGSLRPTVVAAHGLPLDAACAAVDCDGFFDAVAATGGPVYLGNANADHRVRSGAGVYVGSLLALPLVARGRTAGVLFAARDVAHAFERDDEEALRLFAAQASLALEHARLFEEEIEKERLQRELDIARAVQQRLLPQRLPHVHGLGLAATSVPALEVGGDYYDVLALDADRLAVIVADVSGKGTQAAFYMAELKGIFHALVRETETPAAFLRRANRALVGSLSAGTFVTAISATVDARTGRVTLARAGHCPAALLPADGLPRLVEGKGLGLGLDRGNVFDRTLDEVTVALAPGDALVLYTDGVVESRSESEEEYGYDRLLADLDRDGGLDAPDLHAALLGDLNAFLGAARYGDDMTLVVLKWQGVPADAPGAPAADARPAPADAADGREPAAPSGRWPAATTHTTAPA